MNSLSGAEPAPVLTVRNLRKTFTLHTIDGRTLTSLNGVSLDVAAGEHVAIAGPNGAGDRVHLQPERWCLPGTES